jgi:hypothetical protein
MTSSIKSFTKSFIGLIVLIAGFLQSADFRAWLAPIVTAHPKAAIVFTAAAFITALLHNPLVGVALKFEGVAPDQQAAKSQAGFAKLGILFALCGIFVCVGMVSTTTSCTSSQVTAVVQKISAFLPAVETFNSGVASVVAALEPQDAVLVLGVTTVVNNGMKELQSLTATYTASPNASTWQNIVALVDSLVTNGDAALLQASKISNPVSQVKATTVIGALDAVLHVIDGWVQSTQTPAQAAATAAARQVKLQSVVRYWSQQDKDRVAHELGVPFKMAYEHELALGY